MSGIRALRRIQFGRETTAGTKVSTTTLWRGMGSLEDKREQVFPAEDIGYLSGVDRSYVAKLEAGISLDSVEATFEQLPHILEAGIKAATPIHDGITSSSYTRSYVFPTTAPNTLKTYTIEGGDNQGAEMMEYAFVVDFTLEGKGGEAWMVSSNLSARQVVPQAFTVGATLPSVEEILFSKTKIYIDAVTGTFGTTLKTMTLLAASLKVKTGWIPKYTADGQLYYSFIQSTMPEVTLDLTFEHNATAVTEKAAWLAQTPRLIRLLSEGSAFTTAGTTYSKKTMIIDLAGKYEKFEPLDEQDGNDILKATLRGRYNATRADFGKILIANTLVTLP